MDGGTQGILREETVSTQSAGRGGGSEIRNTGQLLVLGWHRADTTSICSVHLAQAEAARQCFK